MAALSEFAMNLCFIREAAGIGDPDFRDAIEQEMGKLFTPYGRWTLTLKNEGVLDIAVAEMKGIGPWSCEAEALQYLERKAGERFWSWLQGYQLHVEPKEDAGSCLCKH